MNEISIASLPKHAKFGASSSDRWLNCSGAVHLIAKAPVPRESPYALEGTRAHECLEKILKNPKGTVMPLEANAEMITHAADSGKEIFRRFKEAGRDAVLLCETKVSLEFIHEGMFGTVDAAVVEEFGRLTVIDFKYGAGIPVDPEENPQLIYYALGLAHLYNYNFSEVAIVIIQPRAEHARGPVREWVTDVDTLIAWGERFREGVTKALKPDAPLKAGDHCRFCPAAAICPEISRKALGKAKAVFGPIEEKPSAMIELPEPTTILDKNLGGILSGIKLLKTWIDAVEDYAMNRAEKGKKIEGFKLVQKRSIRRWTDPVLAARVAKKLLGTEAFSEPELLSPAQLEARFKKLPGLASLAEVLIKKNASNVSSGVTLVPESDKRIEVKSGPNFPPVDSLLEVREKGGGLTIIANQKKKSVKKKTK